MKKNLEVIETKEQKPDPQKSHKASYIPNIYFKEFFTPGTVTCTTLLS